VGLDIKSLQIRGVLSHSERIKKDNMHVGAEA